MQDIVLASNNQGKVREFNQIFAELGGKIIPQSAFYLDSVAETGLSFVENALLKARYAAQHTGLPALADDSGLEVDALRGAPGIFSARYAGADASDAENCQLLLHNLQHLPEAQRSARFQCVIVYLKHSDDPTPLISQGTWEGFITHAPQGENGFGYDPIFWVAQYQCTAAQLDAGIKNQLSHRAQALRAIHQQLRPILSI